MYYAITLVNDPLVVILFCNLMIAQLLLLNPTSTSVAFPFIITVKLLRILNGCMNPVLLTALVVIDWL
ncbi:MAG: hypothetical protein H7296_06415 [Bacteroidia bacterium]|nr:hypothetical protein [Bacteroidia bacterium]